MPGPIVLPAEFGPGVPLSARQLNDLQQEILRQLYAHTHHGDNNGPPLDTEAYENRSVTNPKLADGAVDARSLADGSITAQHLTQNAVTADALADDAVDTAALQNGAVTEAKLSAAVQLLLRRTGDSASSASQIIWRDPIMVWQPKETEPSIIDTFVNPGLVYWKPPVIGIDPFENPIQIDPRFIEVGGELVLEPFKTYGENAPLVNTDPGLALSLGDAVNGAREEIYVVGAYTVTGGNFGSSGLGALTGGLAGGQPNVGGFSGGGHHSVGGFTGGGMVAMHSINQPAAMMESAPMMGLHSEENAPKPTARAASPDASHSAKTAAPIKVAISASGQKAAARMTSIGSVDINGRPVPVGTKGSFTVSSGFTGKGSFLDEDSTLDFRAIGNQGDRNRAAAAGQLMLYNLGIDVAYLNSLNGKVSDENLRLINMAIDGNPDFYKPTNPMWGSNSWLPDILNRPDLFGSGYAISGGRNILDVTRQTTSFKNDPTEYVRVRFITPYLNSAYSVSVTPRNRSGFRMIAAHIRNKSPSQCDIHFTGMRNNGDFLDVNNLSFDLAVFGKLAS